MRVCFSAEDVAPLALGTIWHEDADLDRIREQFPTCSRRFLNDMLLRDVQVNCWQDAWEQEYSSRISTKHKNENESY